MNNQKAGRLILTVIIVHIVTVTALGLIHGLTDNMPISINLLLGELIIAVPAAVFVYIVCTGEHIPVTDVLGFKKIRTGTVFLMILYALLTIPVAVFFNLISMLFTENVVINNTESILSYPVYAVVISVGVLGPVCEELVCRGMIYRGMKKDMTPFIAVLLSAFAFGLFHMNLNQLIYASALGVFLALAVEATGSIWGSVIVHMVINTEQMLQMYLVDRIMPDIYSDPSVTDMVNDRIYLSIIVYMFIAGVCGALAVGVLIWTAHHEGRLHALGALWTRPLRSTQRTETAVSKPITLPYIIAAVCAILFMIVSAYIPV